VAGTPQSKPLADLQKLLIKQSRKPGKKRDRGRSGTSAGTIAPSRTTSAWHLRMVAGLRVEFSLDFEI
jgi:hypothetical protein